MRAWPRDGAEKPSGSFTTMPPVASPMAMRGGVPSRPASAVTMPRTVTVDPTGLVRAAAIVSPTGEGLGDGSAVGVGVGVGLTVAVGVGSDVGDAVGSGVGVGVGAGVGDGGGATVRSLTAVT